ncbi:MAG: alpha-hydroxy-acid oxidizing protein [Bryobacterales bacterium]
MSSHDRIPAPWASTPTSCRGRIARFGWFPARLAGLPRGQPKPPQPAARACCRRPSRTSSTPSTRQSRQSLPRSRCMGLPRWWLRGRGRARRCPPRLQPPRHSAALPHRRPRNRPEDQRPRPRPASIFIDSSGGKNCFRTGGELDTARAAAEHGCMYISNGGVDDFLSSGDAPKNWWQLTTGSHLRNENSMEDFVEKLEDMGATGICFTVDIMHVAS